MKNTISRITARAAMAAAVMLAAVCQGPLLAADSPTLSVSMVPNVTLTGNAGNYALQYASVLGGETNWATLTNLTLTGTSTNWVDYSGAGQSQRFYRAVNNNPNPDLLGWIPAGTFTMGSPVTEAQRQDWGDDETQHTVVISQGFYMSKYLVTQADYLAVIGSNPSYFGGNPNNPVEQVSWNDAVAYCATLTQAQQAAGKIPAGWAYRLPTESEWEYACRAGTTTAFYFGDSINWTNANFYTYYEYSAATGDITTNTAGLGYYGQTTPVGNYQANPWGLYDICGNVWEWCQDWYGKYPTGTVTDPAGASTGSDRVLRGGAWYGLGANCRSAYRGYDTPGYWYYDYGFRPVLAPSQP
jgi:formylglycine-generating enzyme required for sulfatase activity